MEIYGHTTLEIKTALQSVGDVIAMVRGRRSVVSAFGFENKMTGHDVRLWAKAIDQPNSEATPGTPQANVETQALINKVDWPAWPKTDSALPQRD
jgi:hypothetical protein